MCQESNIKNEFLVTKAGSKIDKANQNNARKHENQFSVPGLLFTHD